MNDLQGVRTVQSQAAQYVADVQALMNDLPVAAVPAVVEALLGGLRLRQRRQRGHRLALRQ